MFYLNILYALFFMHLTFAQIQEVFVFKDNIPKFIQFIYAFQVNYTQDEVFCN